MAVLQRSEGWGHPAFWRSFTLVRREGEALSLSVIFSQAAASPGAAWPQPGMGVSRCRPHGELCIRGRYRQAETKARRAQRVAPDRWRVRERGCLNMRLGIPLCTGLM